MNKSTATIAAVLALLTGFVLGQLTSMVAPRSEPVSSVAPASAQDLATARAFYDAMNHYMASGDKKVESMLAYDFVDHTGSLPNDRNATQMLADWSATRAIVPHLQFEIIDVQAAGALVAVRLGVDPGAAYEIPALPVTAPVAGSVNEFLRIEHSVVAERWSDDDRLPGLSLDAHADFDHKGGALTGPAIERLSLAPGQSVALEGRDTAVLRVDSGQLQIEQTGVDARGEGHSSSEPLESGQLRIVDIDDALRLRNQSSEPVEFWAFSLYGLYPKQPKATADATPVATPVVESATLTYMPFQLPSSSPDRLRISVVQLSLPSGTVIAPHTPGAVEQIVVLDGALEANVQDGRALISSGDSQMQPFDGAETASAGQGFSASSIATLSYRVSSAQPATLLVMTIGPVPSEGTPEAT